MSKEKPDFSDFLLNMSFQFEELAQQTQQYAVNVSGDMTPPTRKVIQIEGDVGDLKHDVEQLCKMTRGLRRELDEHRAMMRDLGKQFDDLTCSVIDDDKDYEDRFKNLEGRVNALDETLTDIRSGWISSSSPPMSSKVAENFERRIERLERRIVLWEARDANDA